MTSHAGSIKDGHTLPESSATETVAPAPARLDLRGLVAAHYASTKRLLRRLGVHTAELDDTTQEVFWIAARRLSDIERGSEKSFLYGVALRVASQEVRRQRAADPLAAVEAVPRLLDLQPSPEEHLQQRQARQLLDSVLRAMPCELREVFVLFELEAMAVQEIAALQEIPIGTASSRLRRAREEFSAIAKRLRAALAAQERRRP
ncbi:MAG: sigma-70 family RNA polymerase sigma factor [Polyangiaceae bacterium]